jgi:palmitoyl transferase
MRVVRSVLVCCALLGVSPLASAYDVGEMLAYKAERVRAALREGGWDAYLTGYAWHAPWAYDSKKRDELNEAAIGSGIGRSVTDTDGDRHLLYGLLFRDSHEKPQYTAGYAWLTYWPAGEKLRLGLGYSVGLFARSDVRDYTPLPFAAGLVSAHYGEFELMVALVPGVEPDSGNVALVFGRWKWD